MLLLCALVAGSSSVWADETPKILFLETFGSTTSNTALTSYTGYSATAAMFTTSGNINTHYSGNGSVGKNNLADANLSNGYTDASGLSGCYHTGTANTKKTIIQISNINIEGYESLSLSFGALGGSASHNIDVSYIIDSGSETSLISNGSITNANWTLLTQSIAATGKSLTLIFSHTPSKAWMIRMDDIKVTGIASSGSSTPSISANDVDIDYNATNGSIAYTLNSATGNVSASVTSGDWLTLGTITASAVPFTCSANTETTARTATVTLSFSGATDKVVTVTQAAYSPVVVTLDLTTNTDWEFPTSKTEGPKTYTRNGYSIILEGPDNGFYFDSNNLMLGKKDATLTLPAFGFNVSKIKVYGTSSSSANVKFNIYVGDDAVSTEATSSQVDHEFEIAAAKREVGTIYMIKVTNANNMRITKIEIIGNGCEAREVTSFGWATYVTQNDMKFPAGRAYVVTNASVGNAITKAEVTDVPAGTPVLLKDEGAVTAMLLDAAPDAPATNMLSVCDGTIASGKYAYVLAKNGTSAGFKQWTGDAADLTNRVVMLLDEAAEAPSFIPLDGETTGINTVNGSGFMVNGSEVYNLNGQRVAQPTKGLYIVNGRKVVIK